MNINDDFLSEAIKLFGVNTQLDLIQEECSELITAISHYKRGKQNSSQEVKEELADVIIMIRQASIIFGEKDIQNIIDVKMKRLAKRLKENSTIVE